MSNDMHPDLEWLAENVSKWPLKPKGRLWAVGWNGINDDGREPDYIRRVDPYSAEYTKAQWLQARRDLGLVMTEEEEAAPAQEWGKSVPEGVHSKYHREIKPGVWVDVYDVLHAWRVQNPALQHLIKKALQPGERGHKTREQDMNDIVASALRARELEGA